MTIIDRCTRWSECFKLKSTDTDEIINHFKEWFQDKPCPRTCLTDLRRSYISEKFKGFLEEKGIKHLTTTPYNPTGNNISERINQTITRVLQVTKREKIQKVMKMINFVLQHQPHRVLGCSPHELRYKKSLFYENKNILGGFTIKRENRILQEGRRNLRRLNKNRKETNLQPGSIVYKKVLRRKKLSPYWSGPYEIKKITPDKNVVTISNDQREEKINIKLIRP